MKKMLSIALSMMLVVAMFVSASANTTIYSGTPGNKEQNNGTIELGDYAGETIIVTVTCFDGSKCGEGWGIGGLCPAGEWSVSSDFEAIASVAPATGDVLTFDFNVDEVIAALGANPNVNFYNGFEVTSVEVANVTGDDTGAVAPIVIVSIVALASAAVVVSRKRA